MKTIVTALFFIALVSCVPTHQVIETKSVYNPEDAAFIHEDGNAIVEGQGFLRTTIGEVRTCAGSKVHLFPVTEYSVERMRNIYGNVIAGRSLNNQSVDAPDPRYVRDALETVCDAEGDFQFTNVPRGNYFIATGVWWQIPGAYNPLQGANLMKRIRIMGSEDEHIRVLLH